MYFTTDLIKRWLKKNIIHIYTKYYVYKIMFAIWLPYYRDFALVHRILAIFVFNNFQKRHFGHYVWKRMTRELLYKYLSIHQVSKNNSSYT